MTKQTNKATPQELLNLIGVLGDKIPEASKALFYALEVLDARNASAAVATTVAGIYMAVTQTEVMDDEEITAFNERKAGEFIEELTSVHPEFLDSYGEALSAVRSVHSLLGRGKATVTGLMGVSALIIPTVGYKYEMSGKGDGKVMSETAVKVSALMGDLLYQAGCTPVMILNRIERMKEDDNGR